MELHEEKARKANRAASDIGDIIVKTLTDMRPAFAIKHDLDEQLVTLAIAKAAVGIAADATSQATGMAPADSVKLEDRLHSVVFEAMNEILDDGDKPEQQ